MKELVMFKNGHKIKFYDNTIGTSTTLEDLYDFVYKMDQNSPLIQNIQNKEGCLVKYRFPTNKWTLYAKNSHTYENPHEIILSLYYNDDYLCDEVFIWALEKSGMMEKEHITVSDDDMKEISVTNLFGLFRVISLVSNLPDDMNFNKEK